MILCQTGNELKLKTQAKLPYRHQLLTYCPEAVHVFFYVFLESASIQDDTTVWPMARNWQVK